MYVYTEEMFIKDFIKTKIYQRKENQKRASSCAYNLERSQVKFNEYQKLIKKLKTILTHLYRCERNENINAAIITTREILSNSRDELDSIRLSIKAWKRSIKESQLIIANCDKYIAEKEEELKKLKESKE